MSEPLAQRYAGSIALTAQARAVTPGGAQTMSKQPARFPEAAFPAYLDFGLGARVRDVDGHWYVDWICGLGAVSLGHGHPAITDAVCRQAIRLPLSSLGHPLEEEVARGILALCPSRHCEQVRFVKTGSEACAAAVRIARRATGRAHIITIGYHGWHDPFQVVSAAHPGIPELYGLVIHEARYNDLAHLEGLLWLYHGDVAAVILEPMLLTAPTPDYLPGVRRLAREHGALLILDEMVTAFRWARGGAQEYAGVVADLALYGKALANGYPLAAIAGPEALMRYADVVSGTFGGEAVSLAAAREVLRIYAESPAPITAQWERGEQFLTACRQLGIPADGFPVHPRVRYQGDAMALFLQETARRGLLLHPAGFNVSAALTHDDMLETVMALEGAVKAMQAGVPLEGQVPAAGAFVRSAP